MIEEFYESDIEISDIEKEILEGAVNSISSLFEITDVDPSRFTLTLKNILENEDHLYTLMDKGLSQTGIRGNLLFIRLMPVRDAYITSGVVFPFNFSHKNRIFSDISMEKFKKGKKKLNSTDLYILINQKSKAYGDKYLSYEI